MTGIATWSSIWPTWTAIDSAGIRALVRGHTSARRVDGTLRLAAARRRVAEVLELSHLSGIFQMHESVDAAKMAAWPWDAIRAAAGGTALCAAAGVGGPSLAGRALRRRRGRHDGAHRRHAGAAGVQHVQPFIELGKLVAAALIGILVTAVHQPSPRDRAGSRSMEQAQMLLCVSGALMMIIIGNSLARAFGIAGAASIIRFRTPVDDPEGRDDPVSADGARHVRRPRRVRGGRPRHGVPLPDARRRST